MNYINRLPSSFFALLASCAAVFGALVLAPGLTGGFLLDDYQNIVENGALHVEQFNSIDDVLYAAYSFEPGGGSRSLAMLSFALDFWRAGLDPFAFKVTNLLIHALTTLILSLFFRTLFVMSGYSVRRAEACALVLTLVWAIHPLQVSSVLYIVQRMQTLVTLFVVLSLFFYLQMRKQHIEGFRGRLYGVVAVFFWCLAFASKEDGVLIPLYMFALELTLLQFRAAQWWLSRRIKIVSGSLFLVGIGVYLFVVVPNYWHWEDYPGRSFNSIERLLTQGRVLVMYLGQSVLPYPSSMPFFYDDIVVSKGILQPVTTLLSLVFLLGLAICAWNLRHRKPLFSFGVFLFFSGHFITSNVINLELAFEHRNHLPLVGAILAVGDLVFSATQRWKSPKNMALVFLFCVVALFASLTLNRATIWGNGLRLAEHSVEIAPDSERAWVFLCSSHFQLSGSQPENPHLDMAIDECQRGVRRLEGSAILSNNVVIYKTVKGTVTEEDWAEFLRQLASADMNVQNKGILWVTLTNAESGRYTNEAAVLRTIEIITSKTTLRPREYLRVAAYIFNQTQQPVKAFSYLRRAVELSEVNDPAIQKMMEELVIVGREDWADRLKRIQQKATERDKNE